MNSHSLMFSPNPAWYAIIRMNPVAMVQDLDDPLAMAAAKAMTTRSYLVYILDELALPFPNQSWYPYNIAPIGPSLRAEDTGKGITPEMCIPIYPNETHPMRREPVRPERPFPYKNCYHWFELETGIRVLAKPEMFDDDRAIELSARDQLHMEACWGEDARRIRESRGAHTEPAAPMKPQLAPAASGRPVLAPRTVVQLEASTPGDPLSHDGPASNYAPPMSSSLSTSESCDSQARSLLSEESDVDSVEGIMRMGVFDGPNQDRDLLPLCELWEALAEHLREEDIPDPMGFFQERDDIVKILQDARIRAYAALNAGTPASTHELRWQADRDASASTRGRRTWRIRPRKVVKRLRTRVKLLTMVVSSRIQFPSLPVWP